MPLSDSQRTAIVADLEHPVLSAGTDVEIGADHGVSAGHVGAMRAKLSRDVDTHRVRLRARELAKLLDWKGSLADLVEAVLCDEIARQHRAEDYLRNQAEHRKRAPTGVAPDERRGSGKRPSSVQVAPVSIAEKSVLPASVPKRTARTTPADDPRVSLRRGRGRPEGSLRPRPRGRQRSAMGS